MSINPYRFFCRLLPMLIAALTVIAFLPVLRNGFVEWDDPVAILQNPYYRGLGWARFRSMFTTFEMAVYRPLTWITLGADYLVWGLNPAGYHLTSLFFHAANSILVYWIALQFYCLAVREDLKRRSLQVHVGAAFAALLFSLHPLTVEPVAWVSARSDLVAAFFVFISIVCYFRAHESAFRLRWLITAWLAYGFSILSKTTVMSFPFIVVALDIYPLKRLGPGSKAKWFGPAAQRVWLEKLPFILLSVAAGLLSLAGKSGVISEARPWANVTQAAYALLFYPGKIAFPRDISPFYPVPSSADLSSWPIVAYPLFVTAITIAVLFAVRRWPAVSIVWISYLVLVLPISAIVKYGPQLVADRYAYLSIAPREAHQGIPIRLGPLPAHDFHVERDRTRLQRRPETMVAAAEIDGFFVGRLPCEDRGAAPLVHAFQARVRHPDAFEREISRADAVLPEQRAPRQADPVPKRGHGDGLALEVRIAPDLRPDDNGIDRIRVHDADADRLGAVEHGVDEESAVGDRHIGAPAALDGSLVALQRRARIAVAARGSVLDQLHAHAVLGEEALLLGDEQREMVEAAAVARDAQRREVGGHRVVKGRDRQYSEKCGRNLVVHRRPLTSRTSRPATAPAPSSQRRGSAPCP